MIDSPVIQKAIRIAKSLGITAIGLSGSRATLIYDDFSDFDFCLFSSKIPDKNHRKLAYRRFGVTVLDYFDVDFEVSISDGFRMGKVQCGFLWMQIPKITKFLKNLSIRHDCDEFLPGGLEKTVPLFDPTNTVAALKSEIPEYSEERAKQRIQSNLSASYFNIHVLKWFDKAIYRNDYYSFMKYQREFVENFITAAFALNRTWYADEKRLIENLENLPILPSESPDRLEELMMHRGNCTTLQGSLKTIRALWNDIYKLARKEFGNINLPKQECRL